MDQYGLALRLGKHRHVWPNAFDDRSANENHFDGLGRDCRGAAAHFARELASVGVADHGNIGQTERLLRRVVNFARQQDRSGARAKNRAAARGVRKQAFVETFLDQKFPLRRALAARQNDGVHAFEIARRAHKYVLDAHARERRRVRFKITLNGEYSDFYRFFHLSET